jgi:hypothetical protein
MIKNGCNKFALTIVSAAILTSFTAAAATDDLYNYPDTMLSMTDSEQLKWNIVNNYNFKQPLFLLGHMFGYGWASGTDGQYVGQDFTIRKSGDDYTLNANYNSNDPYSGGYWADKRLKVTVKDMKFYTDLSTLSLGTHQAYGLDTIAAGSSTAINCASLGSDADQQRFTFTYDTNTSWSKADNFNFAESISVTASATVDLGVVSGTTSITGSFEASQGWSETNGGSEGLTISDTLVASVPPRTKRNITVTIFKQEVDIPYTSRMYASYNVNFYNFLRWSGNHRTDHPTNRPFYDAPFGAAGGLNASESLLDKYVNRNISGYSEWDWDGMKSEYGNNFLWAMGNATKRKFGGIMSGKFTTVDATHFAWTSGAALPLEAGDCPNSLTANLSESQKLNSNMMEEKRLDNSASKLSSGDFRIKSLENKSFNYDSELVRGLTITLDGQKRQETEILK